MSFTFFWRSDSPFSQWYRSSFVVNGVTYNCAEQVMMHQKAVLFGDEIIADKILQSDSPAEQKRLGRRVKGFQADVWDQHRKSIVYEGNYAKFTQNPKLKQALLETAGTLLVEASPVDRIWGVGLAADDPRIQDPQQWRGSNDLGEILTRLREALIEESHGASESAVAMDID
ncbi:NADAR family protein [Desmospora profundinema]|uniref:RibA/ribD-fused uncharacterized protein n=1 Tax=Desmospora profundinema TaxID=1571184 RepID=A0ABU1IIN2_9BACL|nr:NADAR family protein [Desmospora profundinema]MDR6224627.1 ribA/ribD-fused uncharacterized protein [Desmospora profundinema]